ncbi:MAG TPA: GNAT family protein [Acidimicrobiia bacterium]
MSVTNSLGQPVGFGLADWVPPSTFEPVVLKGNYVALEPMVLGDGQSIFDALGDEPDSLWTYMSFGPFGDAAEVEAIVIDMLDRADWSPYVVEVDDRVRGFLAYLRIDNPGGVIEIGSIVFHSSIQRSTATTEAIFLLIDHAFECGYRRVEWKCDALNAPSMRAAERLGFTYEGTFRQATHYKGRNRDTAWYAIVDGDWPEIRASFKQWLSPGNFDDSGTQERTLQGIRQDLMVQGR